MPDMQTQEGMIRRKQ